MRTNLRPYMCVFLLVAAGGAKSILAQESTLAFQPYAEVGVIDYEFSFDDVVLSNGSVGDGFAINDNLLSIGVGLTSSYNNFYFDVGARATTQGSDSGQIFLTDIVGGLPIAATHDFDSKIDRKEVDVLLGYNLEDTLNAGVDVYVGYRYAQTQIENSTLTVEPVLIGGDLLSPGEGVFDGVFDIDFTYHGPFAGLAVRMPVPIIDGILTVSPSIGYFSGNFDQKFSPNNDARIATIDNAEADGTSIGFNAGITYSRPISFISDNLGISISVDRSQFDFSTGSDDAEADFEESFNRVRLAIQYQFGE